MEYPTPTNQTNWTLTRAFRHFNKRLFGGELPVPLLTIQSSRHCLGYFHGDRFEKVGDDEVTDEIAMNPKYFATQTIQETLSTLAHEMAHMWQHRSGKPSRAGYHNKQWAAKMRGIGLVPSHTGLAGGKETGQRMSHYIDKGGAFDVACADWLAENPGTLYHDRYSNKGVKKTKYACPGVGCKVSVWGKPGIRLLCINCNETLIPDA